MRSSPRSRPSRPAASDTPPLALHERAEADLAFVRQAMERSTLFTAVPGAAGAVMGATAVIAAGLAASQPTRPRWLAVWLVEAVLAVLVGSYGVTRKARRRGVPLGVGPARRFALGLVPPIVAGAALTVAAVQQDAWTLLPPIWLLCYGIAVLGAGAVSAVPAVPLLGASFVVSGIAAIASPVAWADAYLALTFGVAHIVAGIVVARHHGG